ncbi:MAG: LacI family DNA-binding transcriptional regulator [Verrucomicrobia bacterium]|nr:LacI family DNA-binding transcriptional regulator [Verrucomicrobiota bacterium]
MQTFTVAINMKSPKPDGSITIKEVAAEAGVSTATVSRVLAGLSGVADKVRDRVTRAVAKLDYHPNHLARGLRLGRRKVIGVIIPDLQNSFFTGVAYGVEQALYGAGYTLLLGHSDGLPEREQLQLRVMRAEGVAGLVFIAGNRAGGSYEAIRSWHIPVVAVDRAPSDLEVDLVCSDNREGMRQAVAHLLSLGYHEIALLNGPAGISVTEERLAGYQEALRSAGIPLQDSFIIHSNFREDGGNASMGRFLEMAKPPRAVVVANNRMTLGAFQAINERQARIPEDIALVGFDDMPWASSLRPPLTAVAQPAEELGRAAAQLLLDRLKDPKRIVRKVVLPTRLIVRASCGARAAVAAERPGDPPARKTGRAATQPSPDLNLRATASQDRPPLELRPAGFASRVTSPARE